MASEGLQLCGESARVGDASFRALVQVGFEILLKKKDESHITGELIRYLHTV